MHDHASLNKPNVKPQKNSSSMETKKHQLFFHRLADPFIVFTFLPQNPTDFSPHKTYANPIKPVQVSKQNPIFGAFTWCERRSCEGLARGRCAWRNITKCGAGHCKNGSNMAKETSSRPLFPSVVALEGLHSVLLRKTNKPE